MAAYKNQHYVPEFLLKKWCDTLTGKLHCYRWAYGKLERKLRSPAEVANKADLWTIMDEKGKRDRRVEQNAFGITDTVGSNAHKLMLKGAALTYEQREHWALFFLSLMARNPSQVAKNRRWGLERIPHPGGPVTERTLQDWGLLLSMRDLMSLSNVKTIADMEWSFRSVAEAGGTLLLGDSPLLLLSGLAEPTDRLFMLPLSPTLLFCVGLDGNIRKLDSMSSNTVVGKANGLTLEQATQDIYASDFAQTEQIEKTFKKRFCGI